MTGDYKYYIAYGSNMNIEQMGFRCPDSWVVGTGYLEDYQLEFYLHATVEPKVGARVPVVVWNISKEDERNLDRYEGVPDYYTKEIAQVTLSDGRDVTGLIYIMNEKRMHTPSLQYLQWIREGYYRFGFNFDVGLLYEANIRSIDRCRKAFYG